MDNEGLRMQGQPIGSTNQGMKNASDPAASNPTEEGTGAVASDSLAAESANSGGAFSENKSSDPLALSGSNSTLNNTDIGGATTLAPAPDAAEREAKAAWSETSDDLKGAGGVKYAEGAGGQGKFDGVHSDQGYAGGNEQGGGKGGVRDQTTLGGGSGGSGESATGTGTGTETGTGSGPDKFGSSDSGTGTGTGTGTGSSNVDSTPSQGSKPHGKNITEGGFDSDPNNNASFNNEIGTENDPGRVAEAKFQRMTQESGPDAGGSGPRQKELTGDGQYDALETDQQL
ncbi:hypothetical protein MMC09_000142 [Bachmanniomyces sp. S44760]|nr:hypothetical protein [Bachmanniomyces sp. S44760]